jgi:hypothetical protein
VRRRGAGSGGGGGQGARTGQGNNMSMLRYYTDDSPGLKITPVRRREAFVSRSTQDRTQPRQCRSFILLRSRNVPPIPLTPSFPSLPRPQKGRRAHDERVLHRLRHHAARGVQDLPVHEQVI